MRYKEYRICMYIRLSKEDDDIFMKDESNSITSQRSLIYRYINEHEEFDGCTVIEKCDDGLSGTTFDRRPSFTEMIEMAKKGEIECIIVKDFSRFGRDYIELGDYLEQFFPFLNIRFISINDGYDSAALADGETGGLDVAFRNLVYDYYARETSKKQRIAWRRAAEKGEYKAALAMYGYNKSKTEKGKLVIDPATAPIVREIFEMRISGMTLRDIVRNLNDRNIPCPQEAHILSGITRKWKNADRKKYWDISVVSALLHDEKYTGTMVNLKTRVNPITKKQEKTERNEWVKVKGTHEAIIDYETFTKAASTLDNMQVSHERVYKNIYYCGCCGRMMSIYHGRWGECRIRNSTKGKQCRDSYGSITRLDEKVLEAVKLNVKTLLDELELEKKLKPSKSISASDEIAIIQKSIKLEEYAWMKLYDMYREGEISREDFIVRKKEYDDTIKGMEERLALLREEVHLMNDNKPDHNRLIRFLETDKLTDEIKECMIEKVYVYSKDKIKIIWKFDDYIGCMDNAV